MKCDTFYIVKFRFEVAAKSPTTPSVYTSEFVCLSTDFKVLFLAVFNMIFSYRIKTVWFKIHSQENLLRLFAFIVFKKQNPALSVKVKDLMEIILLFWII